MPDSHRPLLKEPLDEMLAELGELLEHAASPGSSCGEFDWFASDSDGCVGLFTTAGHASVPAVVLEDRARFLCVAEAILTLPASSNYEPAAKIKGNCSEWFEYSQVGLYAFDWATTFKKLDAYVTISRPSEPLRTSALPPEAAEALDRWAFPYPFFTRKEVSASDVGDCILNHT